jgi:excisionase family DNA binding protein
LVRRLCQAQACNAWIATSPAKLEVCFERKDNAWNGEFQRGQMKQRDARISALCQHLRSAIDLLEQITSQPYQPPQTAEVATASSLPLPASGAMQPGKMAYSIKDAAVAVGISRSALYKVMANGDLSTIKIGSRRLIAAEELKRLVIKA